MFTPVNTWTGHHWGKPGVLREAKLGTQLRFLLCLLEGKSSEVQHPRGDTALISPAESNPQLMLTVGEPWVALSGQTPQWVINFQLSRLLKFLGAVLLFILCQEETSLWDSLKQGKPWMPSFCLLNMFLHLNSQSKFSTSLLPCITTRPRLLAKMAENCFRDTVITLITVQFLTQQNASKWEMTECTWASLPLAVPRVP